MQGGHDGTHRTTAPRALSTVNHGGEPCDHAGVTDLMLRAAAGDDVEALAALVHAAYRDPTQSGWTTEAAILGGQRADASMIAELLDDDGVSVVVGTIDGQLVACGSLRHRRGDPVATFGLFAVDPARQGAGIGGALLTHVEDLGRADGADHLRLEVIHTRHELLAWYRRRGYEPTGETLPFPYGDERFGVPRRDDLHFLLLERRLGTSADGAGTPDG